MKKLLFINLFLLFLISCVTHKVIDEGIEKGDVMIVMKGKYSMTQFDSMCIADTLPRNLKEWKFLGLKDYEYNSRIALFYYVKSNSMTEAVYRIEETMDDSVRINKRIIKN